MSMWTQWNKMAFEMKEWCASQPVKAPKCVVRKSDTDYNKFGFLLAQCVQCGKILSLSHFSSSCNLLVIYVGGGACIYLFIYWQSDISPSHKRKPWSKRYYCLLIERSNSLSLHCFSSPLWDSCNYTLKALKAKTHKHVEVHYILLLKQNYMHQSREVK